MAGSGYKESAADKEMRRRERRMASRSAAQAAQEDAAGLTSDLRAVYGMRGLTGTRTGSPMSPSTPASTGGYTSRSGFFKGSKVSVFDLLQTGAR